MLLCRVNHRVVLEHQTLAPGFEERGYVSVLDHFLDGLLEERYQLPFCPLL